MPAAKTAAAAAAAEEDEEDSDEEDSDEEDDEDVKMEQAPTVAAGVKRKAEVCFQTCLSTARGGSCCFELRTAE